MPIRCFFLCGVSSNPPVKGKPQPIIHLDFHRHRTLKAAQQRSKPIDFFQKSFFIPAKLRDRQRGRTVHWPLLQRFAAVSSNICAVQCGLAFRQGIQSTWKTLIRLSFLSNYDRISCLLKFMLWLLWFFDVSRRHQIILKTLTNAKSMDRAMTGW